MTKQAAYQHLQQADALLHEADQDDPHVVWAHRLAHQASCHFSSLPEVREMAAIDSPIMLAAVPPRYYGEGGVLEVVPAAPTPPQDGREGEDDGVSDGDLATAITDLLEYFKGDASLPNGARILLKAARAHLRARPNPAAQPSAPAVQGERKPTEAMLVAARDWYREYGMPFNNEAAIGCWQAMFDAAPPSTTSPVAGGSVLTAPATPAHAGQARVSDEIIDMLTAPLYACGALTNELAFDLRDERIETARLRAELAAANAHADEAKAERDQSKAQHADCERLACATAETLGARITKANARIAELEKAGTRTREIIDRMREEWRQKTDSTDYDVRIDAESRMEAAEAILAALDTPTEGGDG